jgi:hypothetical protein
MPTLAAGARAADTGSAAVSPEQEGLEALRDGMIQVSTSMGAFVDAARATAKDIAKAFDVPLWLLGLAPHPRHLCVECRRRCRGPWQLRKHRRTAHA